MFNHRYFGGRFFGARYFGAGGSTLERLLSDTTAEFVFTAEISPWSIPNQAITTIYLATREFATGPTDTLANTEFASVLSDMKFRRTIVGDAAFGGFTQGEGTLEFLNPDGTFDYLIGDYTIDGREIVVKVGRLTDSYDDFHVIFKGTAGDWFIDDTSVKIALRDYAYKLNKPLQSNIYGGGGGSDGGADLAGNKKPLLFNFTSNVSPPLVEPALLIYQVNDGLMNGQGAGVFDRGVALTFDNTAYANYAALQAAVIAAGSFAYCTAEGFFRLGSTPAGQITASPTGQNGGPISTTVQQILTLTSALVVPTDLYVPSFDLMDTLQPYQIAFWSGTDSTDTVADTITNLVNAAGGWAGFRRDGSFEIAQFSAPEGASVRSYNRGDGVLIDVQREPLPSAMWPPPYRRRLLYNKNWTIQTDLSAGAGTDRISYCAQEGQTKTATDTSIQTNYPHAQDPPVDITYYTVGANAQAEVTRRLALYGTKRSLYRVTVNWTGLARNIGEEITVTWPRWDLTGGKVMTTVDINDNIADKTVELLCYG